MRGVPLFQPVEQNDIVTGGGLVDKEFWADDLIE